jgi:hypothetical protein
MAPPRKYETLTESLERILNNATLTRTGCLLWNGTRSKSKNLFYGHISICGRRYRVHRIVWQASRGQIPKRMQIDHTCENSLCVNVEHLDLVSNRENTRRALKPRQLRLC